MLQGYIDEKHWSKRIGRDQIAQVRADREAGILFNELCQQYANITEEATIKEDEPIEKTGR